MYIWYTLLGLFKGVKSRGKSHFLHLWVVSEGLEVQFDSIFRCMQTSITDKTLKVQTLGSAQRGSLLL